MVLPMALVGHLYHRSYEAMVLDFVQNKSLQNT
jgi:hypothetical protein